MGERQVKTATLLFRERDELSGAMHYVYKAWPPLGGYEAIIVIVVQDVIDREYQVLAFHGDERGKVQCWIPIVQFKGIQCQWAPLWRLGYSVRSE